MSKLHVKDSGSWKWVQQTYVKVSGVWKPAIVWVKTGGVWKVSNAQSRVPQGAILLFVGSVIPAGFSRYTAADNKFIVGAGNSYNVGADYGSTTTTFSRSTTTKGSHNGGSIFYTPPAGGIGDGNYSGGNHNHTYSKAVTTQDVYKDYILIQADMDHATIPEDALVLSASILSNLSNFESTVDRFVRSAASFGGTGGTATPSDSVTSSSNGSHDHGGGAGGDDNNPYDAGTQNRNVSSGNHSHTVTISITLNTMQKYLSAWGPGSAAKGFVEPGAILLHDDDIPPEGYVNCDGLNGTPDMTDYTLRIGDTSNHGNGSGDNSATIDITTSSNGNHNHQGGTQKNNGGANCYHSNNKNAHTHDETFSQNIVQSCHGLRFIMKV